MSFITTSFESLTGLPELVAYLLVFIFGAIIGSFLNVIIHRIPNEESIVFPSSKCPKCKAQLRPYDNIPILSWLILGGKCRNCKEKIAIRYPAVELLTGLSFVLVYWQIGFDPMLFVGLVFVCVIIALMFIDAEHMILPNVITYPFFVFAFAVRIVYPIAFGTVFSDMAYWPLASMSAYPAWVVSLAGAVLGAIAGGGSLWLVGAIWKKLRGVEAMGLGDVKMMAGVGALLGWRLALLSIFLAAFAGALIGIVVIMRQKDKNFQAQIPFGIFLGIGSMVAFLFGEQMIAWYMRTIVP
jgi:leader peptidase (prepilin peptidase) / N-methyltransferase